MLLNVFLYENKPLKNFNKSGKQGQSKKEYKNHVQRTMCAHAVEGLI